MTMRALAITFSLTACWRGAAATEPTEPAPVRVEPRKVAPAPAILDEGAGLLAQAESAFEAGDLARAGQLYEQASTTGSVETRDYARYKLAWVQVNLSRFQDALMLFMELGQDARDERLRKTAGDDAARVYVEIGKPQRARQFFERIDRAFTDRRLGILADTYDMNGKPSEAAVVRAQITP